MKLTKKYLCYKIIFLSAIVFFSTQLLGQKENGNNESLLWSVKGKNIVGTSYVFGTIHLICIDDFLWTPTMQQAFDKSHQICFEMKLDDPNITMQSAAAMIDLTGKKLKDYFTESEFDRVKKYIKENLGMEIGLLQQLKPFALQTFIASKSANCKFPASYEDSLMKIAKRERKEIIGMEELKEQLEVLESMPVDSVIKEIIAAIDDTSKNDNEFNKMVALYKKQALPQLYALITSSADLKDEMGVFLDDRNKKWISRMTEKMNKSSVFFAVGAGHLWGEYGVLNLLKKQGYKVEMVK